MAQSGLIRADTVQIRGEYRIELCRGIQERLEMNGIFLVPENTRDAACLAPRQNTAQLSAQMAYLWPPLLVLATPCRFNEQHLGVKVFQLPFPALHTQLHQVTFRRIGMIRKLVHHRCHPHRRARERRIIGVPRGHIAPRRLPRPEPGPKPGLAR